MTESRQMHRIRFAPMRAGSIVVILLLLFVGVVNVASALITLNWYNFSNSNPGPGGPTAINVSPSANMNIWANVTTSGSNTSDNWQSTRFRFFGAGPEVIDCIDTPDVNSDITNQSLSHTVTAPSTPGTYDLEVIVYNSDDCTSGASGTLSFPDVVNVVPSRVINSITVNSPLPTWGGINVTLNVTTTGSAGADDWESTSYSFDGVNWTCDTTMTDITSAGTYDRDFDIPLPLGIASNTPLTLYMRAHGDDNCSDSEVSNTITTPITALANNPTADPGCGFSVGLIVDSSGSIGAEAATVKAAVIELLEQLNGTGVEVSLIDFDSTATVISQPSVVNDALITDYTNNWTNTSSGGTNWEDAFYTQLTDINLYSTGPEGEPSSVPDFVLFFTDGEPTYYNNPNGGLGGNGSSFTPTGLARAAIQANLLKTAGARVIGIGVGGIDTPLNINRLKAVTGPIQADATPDPLTDDVIITNFDDLTFAFRQLAASLCGSSLTITKEVPDGQGGWVSAGGWDFTADVSLTTGDPNAYVWELPVANATPGDPVAGTTNVNGTLTYQWQPTNPVGANVAVAETIQSGYLMNSVDCEEQRLDGNTYDVTVNNLNLGAGTFNVNLTNAAIGICTVRNDRANLDITKQSSVDRTDPGVPFDYTIIYTNNGSLPLTNVYVVDTLPSVMKLNSYSIQPNPTSATCIATGGDIDGYGATVTCGGPPNAPANYLDPLAPGEVGSTIVLTVQVRPGTPTNLQLTNSACASASSAAGAVSMCGTKTTTTPVTVAYFSATETNGGVRFDWSTATETGNAGFNLYALTGDGIVKLNDELILSQVMDSSGPTDYSIELANVPTGTYYIGDVSLRGEVRAHEPVALNTSIGERLQPEAIDWAAINAESAALEQQRTAETAVTRSAADTAATAAVYPTLDLAVKETGIYRLTYEQIKAAGVDLAGVSKRDLAITNRGVPVASFISQTTFGPGGYIEFIGQELDSLYTGTNVYRLEVNSAMARRIGTARSVPPRATSAYASYYMETVTVERNMQYSYLSTNGDPWYDTAVIFRPSTANKFVDFTVNISDYVGGAGAVTFSMWGASDFIPGMDHHVLLAVNGTSVADEWFDANEVKTIQAGIPAGLLVDGNNQLRLTVPVDSGAEMDAIAIESYGLTYPRAFKANGGRLDFEATARGFHVMGLDSDQVVVYRQSNGRPTRLANIKVAAEGGSYSASFAGGRAGTNYYVSTVGALLTPQISVTPDTTDITSGRARLLIIAHPNFINNDLARLVQAREAQGYTVKVVDVQQVYTQFGGGVFDPQAIRDYIRHGIRQMGVQYVLLVGGDTNDYFNYGGLGSISFIPSLYVNTIDPVMFAPVDPLYTDIDGDNAPDRAIGRFPVRTTAELKLMVDKTLQYDALAHVQTAVFAADEGFEFDSDVFASSLAGWNIEKAYVRLLGSTTARATLINALNAGPRLASFVGHSGPTNWTFAPLFRAVDAAALTNINSPTLVTQWGCWNTYYVDPRYDTLGHKFLLSGMNGAALVTGSSTLTTSDSEQALGTLMMSRLIQNGITVGEAMRGAKVQLAQTHPEMIDVLLGWTILGDPTVIVRP